MGIEYTIIKIKEIELNSVFFKDESDKKYRFIKQNGHKITNKLVNLLYIEADYLMNKAQYHQNQMLIEQNKLVYEQQKEIIELLKSKKG